MNIHLVALCLTLSCLAVPACIVLADQKLALALPKPRVIAENDVLGDWQTDEEGYGEIGPFPAVWKLAGNDVIVSGNAASNAAPLKRYFKYVGSSLIIIPYKGDFVLLPRKDLSVAEKHGFVMTLCLWHVAQKSNKGKY